jgi:large conductance mechanosensitive channel
MFAVPPGGGRRPLIPKISIHPRSSEKEIAVGLAAEFKEFAMKGNVVDLAVGVIIGAAFGKIVSSLVGDVFMPALGKIIGGFNFSDLAITLGKDPTGKEVLIKYGAFIQSMFDFIIIALVLFMAIKGINKLKKPAPAAPAAPAPPPKSELLLEEIRDLLAKRA